MSGFYGFVSLIIRNKSTSNYLAPEWSNTQRSSQDRAEQSFDSPQRAEDIDKIKFSEFSANFKLNFLANFWKIFRNDEISENFEYY